MSAGRRGVTAAARDGASARGAGGRNAGGKGAGPELGELGRLGRLALLVQPVAVPSAELPRHPSEKKLPPSPDVD